MFLTWKKNEIFYDLDVKLVFSLFNEISLKLFIIMTLYVSLYNLYSEFLIFQKQKLYIQVLK